MRNLASCVKVAVDFVLPESLDQAFKFAQDYGNMGKTEAWETEPSSGERVYVDPVNRQHADKLQAELSMCLAAKHAMDVLNGKVTSMSALGSCFYNEPACQCCCSSAVAAAGITCCVGYCSLFLLLLI